MVFGLPMGFFTARLLRAGNPAIGLSVFYLSTTELYNTYTYSFPVRLHDVKQFFSKIQSSLNSS